MFEHRNSGENRRKTSEIFFANLRRAYKDLIYVKKKFKIISCLCTFKGTSSCERQKLVSQVFFIVSPYVRCSPNLWASRQVHISLEAEYPHVLYNLWIVWQKICENYAEKKFSNFSILTLKQGGLTNSKLFTHFLSLWFKGKGSCAANFIALLNLLKGKV